jgi:hypothetical protein
MTYKIKNNIPGFHLNIAAFILLLAMQLPVQRLFAQEQKTAVLKLSFSNTDSTKTVVATLTADSLPLKEKEVHLYAKRMYTLLPVGKVATTDENGHATIDFPNDLPGDQNKMIVIVGKLEKDEIYGTVQGQGEVKWGAKLKGESADFGNRSLSASREKAPMVLVVVSTLIIMLIWGTIFYIISRLFKIKKAARGATKLALAE